MVITLGHPPNKLFALLRYFSIEQNTLAASLGVSHTLVSLWAHGKKPIPEKHLDAIADIISAAFRAHLAPLQAQCDQADRQAAALRLHVQSPRYSDERMQELEAALAALQGTLEPSAVKSAFLDTYGNLLEEWIAEQAVLSQTFYKTLYTHCRTLGEYGRRQPQPLIYEDRIHMQQALKAALASLRTLERFDPTPAGLLAELEAHKNVLPRGQKVANDST